jgi:hypothetical protein
MKKILLLTVITIFAAQVFAQKTPKHSQFQVPIETVKAKQVNFTGNAKAKQFRTNLKEALAEGNINFAGKFIIAEWGCGSGCTQAAIIDAKTGKVFFPDVLWQSISGSISVGEHERLEYKKDSRLLIIAGYAGMNVGDSDKFKHGIFYLEWTGTNLKLRKFTRKPLYTS